MFEDEVYRVGPHNMNLMVKCVAGIVLNLPVRLVSVRYSEGRRRGGLQRRYAGMGSWPYESEEMAMYPCNPAVGNVRNNGPEMLNSA